MESINQLRDLLKHEVNDLYSAEEQIIEALPAMIEKAKDRKLKKSLQDHLKVTEVQKQRLDEVLLSLEQEDQKPEKKEGFLAGLFKGSQKCKGMQGLISEGENIMGMEMKEDVMDAAIIACAQKIEHYEICGYGTARAYAEELQLKEVEKQLKATLDEEYQADDLLTELAVGRLNKEATPGSKTKAGNNGSTKSKSVIKTPAKSKNGNSKGASKSGTRRRSAAR